MATIRALCSRGHVFRNCLINQGFDVALQKLVEDGLGVGLVEIVPRVPALRLGFGGAETVRRERKQLLDDGLLLHRVDEARIGQMHGVHLPFHERLDLHRDGADQVVEVGMVAKLNDLADHRHVEARQEAETLVPDRRGVDADAFGVPVLIR